jgi:hypothetical protein
VDDALVVRGLECFGDLLRYRDDVLDRHRASRHASGEILAVHELHDQRIALAGVFETVNLSNVGVIQRSERLRLPPKALQAIGVCCELRAQNLQRYFAIEPIVAGAIDFAHPACAERRHDRVRTEVRPRCEPQAGIIPTRLDAATIAASTVDTAGFCT